MQLAINPSLRTCFLNDYIFHCHSTFSLRKVCISLRFIWGDLGSPKVSLASFKFHLCILFLHIRIWLHHVSNFLVLDTLKARVCMHIPLFLSRFNYETRGLNEENPPLANQVKFCFAGIFAGLDPKLSVKGKCRCCCAYQSFQFLKK